MDRVDSSDLTVPRIAALKKELIEWPPKSGATQTVFVTQSMAPRMDLTQRLLTSLGAPVVKTDADGLFVINATPDSWLVAIAKRKVADQVSIYFWIFAIKDDALSGHLLISNDTLIEQTARLVTVLDSLKAQRSDSLPVPTISMSPELTDWISKSKEEIRVVLAATKTKAAADTQKFLESLRIGDPTPAGDSNVLGIEGAFRIPVRWIPRRNGA